MQHTPGPWELDDEDQVCANNKVIASVEWRGPLSKDEVAANGRLIIAAPDMLKVLCEISEIDAKQCSSLSMATIQRVNDAIARATVEKIA